MSNRDPHIFSTPPGTPFLPSFVDALLQGKIIKGFPADRSDPLALAKATIYVPTRRAARSLRSLLVEKSHARSAILPTIRALGDVDEEAVFFDADAREFLQLNPPINKAERLLLLTRLIKPWRESLPEHVRALFGVEDVSVPTTTADAIWLARDLANLMDQVETESADWAELKLIAPDELADWWRVTLSFLEIVTTIWPEVLKERGLSNPAAYRNRLIEIETDRLTRFPPEGPVIAAGTTGSIPATAELIATIAKLPQGALVLPGLDRDLDDAAWHILGRPEQNPSIFGHPQYGFYQLLTRMSTNRDAVEYLPDHSPEKRTLERIAAEALRPAESTEHWRDLLSQPDMTLEHRLAATKQIDMIEAANEREEALSVACALREAISDPNKTAALVTADRNLARRVAAELARFGIEADDSGGRFLRDAEPVTLMRLVIETIFNPGDPVALLALLKHPLTKLGKPRIERRLAAEALELIAFRGGTGRASIAELPEFFEGKLTEGLNANRKPLWIDLTVEEQITNARVLCEELSEAVKPLADFTKSAGQHTDMAAIVRASVEVLETLARDEQGNVGALYSGEAGEQFASLLRNLIATEADLEFETIEWPAVFEALISGETVKPRPGGNPRLFIWGALEARLQTIDTVIIGGLNEGSWPSKTRNDPFMSRPMKAAIALEPPERRTGLAAHDFQMALGMDHVVLSRADRTDNAPTVPSRWLQRLQTVLGNEVTDTMRQRGGRFLHWAREIDRSADIPFVKRPEPKPPVSARPTHFSVTDIETLRRDPYAIYARKILKLNPLDPLIRDPGPAERGTLFHDIIGHFTQSGFDVMAEDSHQNLIEIGRQFFAEADLPIEIEAVWWPRFEALVPEFLNWERERNYNLKIRHAEIASKKREIGSLGITLSGRADRVDVMQDGTTEIIDFKTGSTPSLKQAHILLSPQLALEAALQARGAFEEVGAIPASDLLYVRLKASGAVVPESILKISRPEPSQKSAPEIGEEAWRRLEELLSDYKTENKGYLSRALPFRETDLTGDYDHLARVLEWSAGGADGGEGASE
ncbi:double-strand break repair protein AddB [Paenochrobactrum pullorum]|uniref:double-strand break repair protein AddB n=1 Tax=Paenochrobactrum pullorum TaxID=1324351 RepID=UPI0035BC58B6